ncbi:hypothetical protein UFOVP60_14 [uncultured Caudovirales phage]|uniref:Uncharacterized protein n=1 Tax=uncultured Caudovirales phage TaxID=2100421 RepID=A0A6J5TAU3_9CAUD|nr:hypothetical protein UFOVP60_14 [uncultured Caudovirales phage]
MTNFVLALATALALITGLQTIRLQQAQEALQHAQVAQATQVAQVRHTRLLRASRRLAGESAATAVSIAGSAPASWASAPIPDEIHEALRSFDASMPIPPGRVLHPAENSTIAPD